MHKSVDTVPKSDVSERDSARLIARSDGNFVIQREQNFTLSRERADAMLGRVRSEHAAEMAGIAREEQALAASVCGAEGALGVLCREIERGHAERARLTVLERELKMARDTEKEMQALQNNMSMALLWAST